MKNIINMIIVAILAMAFAFPAVAADQTKQVKKPQVQQVSVNPFRAVAIKQQGRLANDCPPNKNDPCHGTGKKINYNQLFKQLNR